MLTSYYLLVFRQGENPGLTESNWNEKKIRHKQHNLTTDFFSGEAGIELKPHNMKTCGCPTN